MKEEMALVQVGVVRRCEKGARIQIDREYREGLEGLDDFSHCHVLWWANADFGFDKRSVLKGDLPYAPGHTAGVFACRGPFRPNLINMTVCPIVAVNKAEGTIDVADIDAMDGTPVVDVKAYYGICDRVREPRGPEWLPAEWGDWVPENGIGLSQ